MRSLSLALLLAATLASLSARAGAFTDLWYDPHESGWGMNVVQQDEIVFITLFVYAPDGSPTWYFAPDARLVSIGGGDGLPSFAGTLYRARGPWFGGAFDPTAVAPAPAGDIAIEALALDRMLVRYRADGASVQRETVRQTWRLPRIGPFYLGTFNLRQVRPDGGLFGVIELRADVLFFVDQGVGRMRADDDLGRRCEYVGSYVQAGSVGSMAGNYTCTAGRDGIEAGAGTFEMTQIEVTANGLTAALRTSSPSLEQSGRFGGIRP